MAMSEEPSLTALPSSCVLSFLGIRDKDLPYGGKPKVHSTSTVSSKTVPFALSGHDEDEASCLLSSLTGTTFANDCVANAAVKKSKRSRALFKDAREQGIFKQETDIYTGSSTYEEVGHHKDAQHMVPGPVRECPPHFEKALDTTDLSFWMYTVVPDGKANQEEESYSDADSEELERRAAIEKVQEKVFTTDEHGHVDDHAKREEFRARVKESLGFVRMRTEMLQDLSLGEASKDESPSLAGGGDASFMSSSSVLVKHARKLAGLLHTEEQALGLQDLYQWFQNIGKTLGEDALGASPKSTLHNQLGKLRSLNVARDLFKAAEEAKPLPTPSPYELLKQVEHDVRDRLANLYQGKNFILSQQADNWAKGTQLEDNGDKEEEFNVLQSELVTNGCPLTMVSHKKSKKSSHKGKKKGASGDSDGMNSGSSRSESSSAQSSSRPTNTKSEETKAALSGPEQPSNKSADEKNVASDGKADSKNASKVKKKKTPQKTEKKKGEKAQDRNDGEKLEIRKRSSSTSEEASSPVQASNPSVSLSIPEATPLNATAKEEKGVAFNLGKEPNNGLSEGTLSSTSATIEGVQSQVGAKVADADSKRQSVDGKPAVLELSRVPKGEGDFVGIGNKLILPKASLNVLDVKPSDSASVQILPKPKRKSRRLSSEVNKDEIVQTDDVAILSLEDCDVDSLQLREYQAADIKDLLEKMKKLQKQLQFWRTKNWAEKHTGQGHILSPPTYNQFIKVDASPDMGMFCYYNSRTGIHMIKNVSELETSMQQSIMHLVGGPSQSP